MAIYALQTGCFRICTFPSLRALSEQKRGRAEVSPPFPRHMRRSCRSSGRGYAPPFLFTMNNYSFYTGGSHILPSKAENGPFLLYLTASSLHSPPFSAHRYLFGAARASERPGAAPQRCRPSPAGTAPPSCPASPPPPPVSSPPGAGPHPDPGPARRGGGRPPRATGAHVHTWAAGSPGTP